MKKPDPETEAPISLEESATQQMLGVIEEAFAEFLSPDDAPGLAGRVGQQCAWLFFEVGPEEARHQFELFARELEEPSGEGMHLLLDFLGGALAEFFDENRAAGFALDFVGHPYEGITIFARSETQNLKAERLAAALLAEDA